jgi:hypothetical protein
LDQQHELTRSNPDLNVFTVATATPLNGVVKCNGNSINLKNNNSITIGGGSNEFIVPSAILVDMASNSNSSRPASSTRLSLTPSHHNHHIHYQPSITGLHPNGLQVENVKSNNASLNLSMHTAEEFGIEMLTWLHGENGFKVTENEKSADIKKSSNATLV